MDKASKQPKRQHVTTCEAGGLPTWQPPTPHVPPPQRADPEGPGEDTVDTREKPTAETPPTIPTLDCMPSAHSRNKRTTQTSPTREHAQEPSIADSTWKNGNTPSLPPHTGQRRPSSPVLVARRPKGSSPSPRRPTHQGHTSLPPSSHQELATGPAEVPDFENEGSARRAQPHLFYENKARPLVFLVAYVPDMAHTSGVNPSSSDSAPANLHRSRRCAPTPGRSHTAP